MYKYVHYHNDGSGRDAYVNNASSTMASSGKVCKDVRGVDDGWSPNSSLRRRRSPEHSANPTKLPDICCPTTPKANGHPQLIRRLPMQLEVAALGVARASRENPLAKEIRSWSIPSSHFNYSSHILESTSHRHLRVGRTVFVPSPPRNKKLEQLRV